MHQDVVKMLKTPRPHQVVDIFHRASSRCEDDETPEAGVFLFVRKEHIPVGKIIETSFIPDAPPGAHAFARTASAKMRLGRGNGRIRRTRLS